MAEVTIDFNEYHALVNERDNLRMKVVELDAAGTRESITIMGRIPCLAALIYKCGEATSDGGAYVELPADVLLSNKYMESTIRQMNTPSKVILEVSRK